MRQVDRKHIELPCTASTISKHYVNVWRILVHSGVRETVWPTHTRNKQHAHVHKYCPYAQVPLCGLSVQATRRGAVQYLGPHLTLSISNTLWQNYYQSYGRRTEYFECQTQINATRNTQPPRKIRVRLSFRYPRLGAWPVVSSRRARIVLFWRPQHTTRQSAHGLHAVCFYIICASARVRC